MMAARWNSEMLYTITVPPPITVPLAQTVTKVETTFFFGTFPNPSAPGQEITLYADLLPYSKLQTGNISFYHEGGLLGTVALVDQLDPSFGTPYRGATFHIDDLPPGVHSIRVRYEGDFRFSAATSTIALHTITGKQATTIDLRNFPNPATVGEKVSFFAHILPGSDRQTGNVTFFDGNTALGTVPLENSCGIFGSICRAATLNTADDLIETAGGDFAVTYDPQVVKRVVGVTQTGLAAGFPAPAFNDTGSGLLTIALSNDAEINGTGDVVTVSPNRVDFAFDVWNVADQVRIITLAN